MISLGAPKINFQCDNPDGFAQLLAAVETHMTEEDLDAQSRSETSTPGGPDSNQLAFQVYLFITSLIRTNAGVTTVLAPTRSYVYPH